MFQILTKTQTICLWPFPLPFLHRIAAPAFVTAVALIAQLLHAPPLNAQSNDRPNIVLIFSDDQGWNDIGCYGSEIPTPNIDRLAAEGLKFTQFYAASSICTPSRFGLLTGRYPHRSQDQLLNALMFLSEADEHRGLREHETTYVKLLKDAGYQTALVGKWHLGHGEKQFWPTEHGFHEFFGHTAGCVDFFTLHYGNQPDWYRGRKLVSTDGYATDVITEEAIRFIRQQSKSEHPFYLHVSYNAPHFGKGWDEEAELPVNVMQPKPADLERVAEIADPLRRAFAAKVVGMDEGIGQLMKTLKESGVDEETLVVFMTDHGGADDYGGSNKPLRGDKATLFEGGLRVPCIARWPGRIAAGTESDALTCAIDVYPTLCGIAGIDLADAAIDGRDLRPILKSGGSKPEDRELVWRTNSHAELDRGSWGAIRQGDWKWLQAPGSEPMLFHLRDDPNETTDLAATHPDRTKAMGAAFRNAIDAR